MSDTAPDSPRSPTPSMAEDDAAYNIYARQLLPRKHGYPIWLPEHTKFGEVQIGDVGYLRDGGFYRMFNAVSTEQQDYGIPHEHEPFVIREYLLNHTKDVIKGNIVSKSVKSYDISGGAESSIAPIGGGLKFTCEREHGAFVVTSPSADRTQMHPSKALVHYIRTRLPSWHHFASDELDLLIKSHDIIFVSGVVKTDDWGLGAFVKYMSGGEVSFQASLGPFVDGRIKASLTNSQDAIAECRAKKIEGSGSPTLSAMSDITEQTLADPSSSSLSLKRTQTGPKKDQCVFLNYYKMKRRLWRNRVVQAAAGPDERDPDSGSEDEGDMSVGSSDGEMDCLEVVGAPEKMFDPVDYLLDYILDYVLEDGTQAEAAIAGIDHLYALFDDEFPDDIPAALQKLKPPVMFVDEGVASLACAEWREEYGEAEEAEYIRARQKQKAPEAHHPSETETSSDTEAKKDADQPQSPSEADESSSKRPRTTTGHTYIPVRLDSHTGGITCLAWSPDGRYFASGSEDHTIALRDGTTGQVVHTFTDHSDPVWSFGFSPDGTRLASGSSDGAARVWDVEAREGVAVLHGHSGDTVHMIQFTPDGAKIVTCGVDGTIRIWDAATGALLHTLENPNAGANTLAAALSPDGKWVACCGSDHEASDSDDSKDLESKQDSEDRENVEDKEDSDAKDKEDTDDPEVPKDADNRKDPEDAEDSQNAHDLEDVQNSDDVQSSEDFEEPEGVKGPEDAKASKGVKNCARIWNIETGELHQTLKQHTGVIFAIDFDHESRRVVTCSDDSTSIVWKVETGQALVVREHPAPVWKVAFSPNGEYVMSVSHDQTIKVFHSFRGELIHTFDCNDALVQDAVFSPDSRYLASSGSDNEVLVWDLRSGKALPPMSGHEDRITTIRFSPDSRSLVSGSDDCLVYIWTLLGGDDGESGV